MNQISLAPLANFNSAIPWGLWVVVYVWLVGISVGTFLIISWLNLRNVLPLKNLNRVALSLSLSTLLAGLLSIQIDLGHIERAYKLFLSPNLHSPMGWMGILYNLYLLVLIFSFFRLKKEKPKLFFIFSILLGLGLILVESLLFARPPGKHWHSLVFVMHFFSSSLVAGIAALLVILGLFWRKEGKVELVRQLSKIAMVLVSINLILEISEMFSFGAIQWPLVILNILALGLLATRKSWGVALAGAMVGVAVFLSKYHAIIAGQAIEPYRGFAKAYIEPRLQFSYAPSSFEILVAAVILGIAAIVFVFLYWILPFGREEKL
jgi:protein NrfD